MSMCACCAHTGCPECCPDCICVDCTRRSTKDDCSLGAAFQIDRFEANEDHGEEA